MIGERADEAGVLLAQSLLDSNAGHRPVSLVGFSFGARMLISCLKELARNQAIWERRRGRRYVESSSKAGALRNSFARKATEQREVQRCGREPASVIENCILMGCPASLNGKTWQSCRDIVGGRLVNCYSKNDMILALMYRVKNLASSLITAPVGISHVNVPGVENYDVSPFVASHADYCVAVREILEVVG